MTAFVNPKYGDDATATMDSRKRPWRTHAAALAALEAAQKQHLAELAAATSSFAVSQTFQLIETHKPLLQ